jgi:hypothetical protein
MAKTTNYRASSFWLDRDFDVSFKSGNTVNYTKLAAAQRAIGNFVNIVTGKQIPVVFQSNDSSFTDGQSVTIGTNLEDANFDPAVGLALHEGSHIAYTDFSLFKGARSLSESEFARVVRYRGLDPELSMTENQFGIIKDLLNWIEDRRIDFKVYTQAPGYRMYYEAMYNKYFNDKIIDKALKAGTKNKETVDCYLFHIINFTNVNRDLNALSKLNEIWNVIDLTNIDRLDTTIDALHLACDVYKIIESVVKQEALDEVNNVFKNAGMDDDDEGDDGDGDTTIKVTISDSEPTEGVGDGQGDSEGQDGEDSEGQDSEGQDGEDSEDDKDSKGSGSDNKKSSNKKPKLEMSNDDLKKLEKAIQEQKKFIDGKSKKTGRLSKSQSRLVNAMRESGTESRGVATDGSGTMNEVETVVIKKLTPAVICAMPTLFRSGAEKYINGRELNSDSYEGRKITEMSDAVTRGLILGKQLGTKLQLRNADKTLKSTRLQTGKIDRRLISQLGYDNVNVFHRIVTDRFKNYFIHISIDASGSMDGKKLLQAITSATAIAQAASMTTGIRVQISFRGTSSSMSGKEQCVTLYAYDSAHDKISKIRSLFKYINYFGCTPEGVAFKSIIKDIKKDARGDELIFINYSDGAPTRISGSHPYFNGVEFTRKVVGEMRDLNINVISYFIYDKYMYDDDKDSFTRMYGPDSKFIRPDSMTDISKTINAKFLEIAK